MKQAMLNSFFRWLMKHCFFRLFRYSWMPSILRGFRGSNISAKVFHGVKTVKAEKARIEVVAVNVTNSADCPIEKTRRSAYREWRRDSEGLT